ncbi:hypothetical protein [Facklamia sp. 7083-14-GEN3]|uniref:hypothetical protein n=1 Tax=Facklamia sp. 7083-14-GEN3 TaxID=2973478 RepID=UPI00215BD805|nr:hypothetical protein [Facklamia sp. 7083-14-GEN3]MCR8968380.1 hypothetical protein [Facklamia sp. 7083-14-GEN3]
MGDKKSLEKIIEADIKKEKIHKSNDEKKKKRPLANMFMIMFILTVVTSMIIRFF